jgi:hypothetical protein
MSWLEFNLPFSEFALKERNRPGTLIEVLVNKKRKQFLIGDVCKDGSQSNKSSTKPFENEDIVLRYRILWTRI